MTTIMPTISRDLDGLGLYALAFAAPLASSVVGMVAAGLVERPPWSGRPAGRVAGAVLARRADLRARAVDGGLRRRPGDPGTGHGRADREPVRRGRRRLPVPPPALDLRELRRRVGAALAVRAGPRGPRRLDRRLALGVPRRRRPGGAGGLPHRAGRAGLRASADGKPAAPRSKLYWADARRGRRARASSCSGRAATRCWPCSRPRSPSSSRSSPSAADAAPHAPRRPRPALGDRHPRPDERRLLLRPGLHRPRAAGALGLSRRARPGSR